MSSSKLALYGIGTALFRTSRTITTNSPFLSFKPILPFPPLHFHHRTCFSATEETTPSATASDQLHPWPEWVSFIDRLNTKGYFTKPRPSDGTVYVNVNLLKDACLSFGRDRYDIFKLLPVEDIQAIVEGGCPNLLRKAVNSAKRLRAHLKLEEADVCSACSLRGSCDRAYVTLNEFEADARTVDIVRILLFYAIDPLVFNGGEKQPGREVIDSSVRKLLSQLIELSETSTAPPPAPAPVRSKRTAQEAVAKGQLNSMTNKVHKDVEMKSGDWMCTKCNFMNFSRNMQCLNCKDDRPKNSDLSGVEMKQGDWICPECNFLNFSRNKQCLKCKTEGPERVNLGVVEMKKGDWTCPKCEFKNYASNVKCLRCPEPRPKKNAGDWNCPKCQFMNFASNVKCKRCLEPNQNQNPKKYPGDWNCPKCDFYNYTKNMACLKCNTKRPKEQPSGEYEENIWRR